MKKWTYLLIVGTVFFFLGTSVALANDPPHTADNESDCDVCHGQALFMSDPGGMTPDELTDAYNNICLRCHDDDPIEYHGENAPKISSHDSATVSGRFTFKTGCVDCHHPHYQDQFWNGRKYFGSEWRLATGSGVLGGTETDPITGASLTVINYTGLVVKAGTEWTDDPATLANKTGTSRGAMFLPNYNSPYSSRIIVSMTASESSPGVWQGTMKVKGAVTTISAGGFAIALGQIIKRELPYPTASGYTVVFLDHTGEKSFAHNDGLAAGATDSTVTGVCQACHTLTNHWQQTPDATRDNHFGGTNCMNCHSHATGGFKPTYEDHYDTSSPYVTDYSNGGGASSNETCISCHASAGTYKVDRDYVTDVHNSTCDNCHLTVSPPVMKVGDNGNGDATVSDGDNSCSDCHGTAAGYTYNTDFEGAHDVKDHDGLTGKTGSTIVTNCNYCHTGDIVDANTLTADIHNLNCFNCHTNTSSDGQLHAGATDSSYSGVISIGDATNHTIGTTSNCGECHATRAAAFSTHDHSDTTYHQVGGSVRTDSTVEEGAGDTSQNSAQQCSVCHNNSGSLTGWDDIYIVHSSSCNTCHNATRDTSKGGLYSISETIQTVIADNGDPTNCTDCHRDKSTTFAADDSIHGDHEQEGWVRGYDKDPGPDTATTCIGCHGDGNDTHDNYVNNVHSGTCGFCHTNPSSGDYSLKVGSSAENHRVPEDGAENTCLTCHSGTATDFEGGHLNEDHQSTAFNDILSATASNCTISCHDASSAANIVTNTHNNNCYDCHTNTGNDGQLSDGTGVNSKDVAGDPTQSVGTAQGHTINSTSTCADCHSDHAADFINHKNYDHDPIVASSNCTTTCHAGDLLTVVVLAASPHTGCTDCHTNTSSNGQLRAGAQGDATTHTFGQTSSCASCHTAYNTSFWVGHLTSTFEHQTSSSAEALVGSPTCTTACHPGSTSAYNIVFTTHNSLSNSCANCHTDLVTDGTLESAPNGDASGHELDSTSSCVECHSDYASGFESNHDVADHSGLTGKTGATPVADCNGCHDASTKVLIVSSTHNNTCTNCHTNTSSDGELVGAGAGGFGTTVGHSIPSTSNCADCHAAREGNFETHIHGTATAHKTGGSGTTVAQGAFDHSQETSTLCSACHQDKSGGATTLATWDEIAYEHDLDGTKDGVGSCVTCHNATRDVCSDGAKCATGANTIQTIIAANGDPTNCLACHVAKIDSLSSNAQHGYLPHDDDPNRTVVTYTGAGAGASDPVNCKVCHDDNTPSGFGQGEVVYASTTHGGTCATCHSGIPNPLVAPTGLAPGIDAGAAGTDNGGGSCVVCHNASYSVHLVNFSGATLHNNVSATYAGTNDCDDCHGGAGSLDSWSEIETLHTECSTCHNSTNADVVSAIASGRRNSSGYTGSNSTVNCDSCHITDSDVGPSFNVDDAVTPMGHGQVAATVRGEHNRMASTTDCSSCHTMGTAQARIELHTSPHNTGNTGSCFTCHTAADDTTPAASASTVINNGKLAGSDATQNCAACHVSKGAYLRHGLTDDSGSDGVVDAHDQLDAQTGSATSTCTNCHLNNPLDSDLKMLQTHTRWNSGYDCLTCHNATGTVATVIDAGWANTPNAAQCDECHTTYGANWYLHTLNHDDTGTRPQSYVLENSVNTPNTVNCTGCHTASASPFIGAGEVHAVGNTVNCDNCHTAAGVLRGSAVASGGECATCHTTYFNGHSHVHDVAYDPLGPDGLPGSDGSDAGDGDTSQGTKQGCADCHTGSGSGLGNWAGIYAEHNSSCALCHNYNTVGNQTGDANTPLSATVTSTINSGTNVKCRTCHVPKVPDVDHGYLPHNINNGTGLGYAPITPDGSCNECHQGSGDYVVYTVHNGQCSYCHDSVPGLKASGPKTDFNETSATSSCTTCHNDSNNTGFTYAFHGTSWSHTQTTTRHDKFNGSNSTQGYDCQTCHNDMTNAQAKLTKHMVTNTVNNCTICHFPNDHSGLNDAPAQAVIADGKEHNGNDNIKYCESCHTAKGVYDMHGMTDDSSPASGIGDGTGGVISHDNISNSVGAWTATSGAVPSNRATAYTGKIDQDSYTGLFATDYNCGDCHSATPDTKAISSLEGMHLHTSTNASATGSGDCLTCHDPANELVDNMQAGFTSNGSGTINCEDCHNTTATTDGNGPSGEAMYQYDGTRHHKTSNAQSGNCEYCHADPRPTTTTAYAFTADVNTGTNTGANGGAYDDGWIDDYNVAFTIDNGNGNDTIANDAAIPKQLACRLCHTNYETWSTDVYADQTGSGTTYTNPEDLHGYNISGQATGYSATGLTVYANDYDNLTLNNSYPSGSGNRGVRGPSQVAQTSVHRLEPNDGSSKIAVNNYGACFGCHSIQIFHAAPIEGSDYTGGSSNNNSLPYDTLRYAPGRSVFNLLRGASNNTQDWNDHRLPSEYNGRTWNGDRGQDLMDGLFGKNPSTNPANNEAYFDVYSTFSLIATPLVTGGGAAYDFTNHEDLAGIENHDMPYFPDIDYINISLAEWDGSTLTVDWTSSIGTGEFYDIAYSADGTCDTTTTVTEDNGDGTYSFTCSTVTYAAGATVSLLNSGSGGSANDFVDDVSNIIPVSANDSFSTTYNVSINDDVSTNDTSGEGSNTWALVADVPGGEGTLTFNSDGTFTYVPGTFVGVTSFTYTVTDSTPDTSSPAGTVTLTVNNQTPVAANDAVMAAVGVTYNGDVTVDNGSGVDDLGDLPATIGLVADVPGGEGTLTLNANGTFSYDDGGYVGLTTFTYNITDANSTVSNTATVSITVAVIPVATNDSVTTNEGVTLNGDVSVDNGNGADTPGDAPNTWTLVADVPGGEGTLTLNANGTFTYVPGTFIGATSFTYKIVDNIAPTDSNTATVSITVNDLPVPVDDTFSVQPEATLNGDVKVDNGNGADDLGNGLGSINLESGPTLGSFTSFNADGTFSFDATGLTDGQTATFTYSITDSTPDTSVSNATGTINIQANQAPVANTDSYTVDEDSTNNDFYVKANDTDADGDPITLVACGVTGPSNGTVTKVGELCRYTPTGGYFGADSFTYTINDGTTTSTGTVNITVLECSVTTVDLLDQWTDYYNATPNNQSGNSGTGMAQNITPTSGTDRVMLVAVTMDNNGSVTGNVTSVRLTNGSGTLFTEIYSTNGNAAQHAWMGYINESQIAAAGTPFRLYLTYDNNQPGWGSDVTSYHVKWATYENVHQTDIYTTTNGRVRSNSNATDRTFGAQLDYEANGRTIVIGGNGGSPATAIIDQLGTGDAFSEVGAAALTSGHSSRIFDTGVHAAGGNYETTTRVNFSGTTAGTSAMVGVSLKATAGGSCTYNTAPTATADSDTVAEDSTNNVIDVLNLGTADSDPEGDSLTVTDCGSPSNGTSAVSANGDSCLYTPTGDYAGADSFIYTIADGGGLTDTATVSITVTNSNDPPVAQNDAVNANVSSTGNIYNVLADNGSGADSDIDGDTLCITSIDTTGTNGTVSIVDAGACDTQISYDAPGSAGSDTFTYTITDGNGGNDTATVTVTITAGETLSSVTTTWADPVLDATNGGGMNLIVKGTSSKGNTGQAFTVDYYDTADRAGTETTYTSSGSDFTASWSGSDFTIIIGSRGTSGTPITWFRDSIQVTTDDSGDATQTLTYNCTMDPNGTYIEFENYDNFVERNSTDLTFSTVADAAASNGSYGYNAGAGDTWNGTHGSDITDRDRADYGTTGSGLNFGGAAANWYWEFYMKEEGSGDSLLWGVDAQSVGSRTTAQAVNGYYWADTAQNGAAFFNMSGSHYISLWPREGSVGYDGFLMATGATAEADGNTVHPEAAAFTYKVIEPSRCP